MKLHIKQALTCSMIAFVGAIATLYASLGAPGSAERARPSAGCSR